MGYSLLRLYKYCKLDEWAFANLARSTLYFNQFSKMNDPNEVLVHRRWASKIVRDESVLLCSFAEDNKSPLMWERYGNHFAGLCLRYEIPVQKSGGYLFNNDGDIGMYFRKVTYFEEEELVRRPLNDSEFQAAALDVFSEKTKEWEQEMEYRSLLFTNDSNQGRIPHARPNNIRKEYLRSVAFGQNTNPAMTMAISTLVYNLYSAGVELTTVRFRAESMELSPYLPG